jgi:hypothetical protein
MDHTPPLHADTSARLCAALDRADTGLAEPGDAWLAVAANRGIWAAWLHWMLRLLALEFALAWGDAGQHPGMPVCASDTWPVSGPQAPALAGTTRQLPRKALDRKIDRLLEAAARLWAGGDQPPARPRRRRRRLLLDVVRWIGLCPLRFCPAGFASVHLLGARVRALCKPGRSDAWLLEVRYLQQTRAERINGAHAASPCAAWPRRSDAWLADPRGAHCTRARSAAFASPGPLQASGLLGIGPSSPLTDT